MKDIIIGTILAVACVGGIVAIVRFSIKINNLSGVGSCVETTANQEGFTGTSKEKWDIFAEYCAVYK